MSLVKKALVISSRALIGLLSAGLFLIFILKDVNVLTVFFAGALFIGYWWIQQYYVFSAAFLRKKKYYNYLIVISGIIVDDILQYCRYDEGLGKYVFVVINEIDGEPQATRFLFPEQITHIYGRIVFLPWDEKKKKRSTRHQ
jgi:hypothetical protein